MTATYSYSPTDFWPPLATLVLVVLLGLYSWRRREVPGARYFASACLFWFLLLVGIAAEVAAVDPAAQIAWYTFQAIWQLPIVTAVACFSPAACQRQRRHESGTGLVRAAVVGVVDP